MTFDKTTDVVKRAGAYHGPSGPENLRQGLPAAASRLHTFLDNVWLKLQRYRYHKMAFLETGGVR